MSHFECMRPSDKIMAAVNAVLWLVVLPLVSKFN